MAKTQTGTIGDVLMAFERVVAGNMRHRLAEDYGDVELSVQASRTHYCQPRVDGLELSEYESVGVAFILKGKLTYPSVGGVDGFDELFEPGMNSPVAGYVSQADVSRLRDAITAKYPPVGA